LLFLFLENIKEVIEEIRLAHPMAKKWPWSEHHSNIVNATAYQISENDYKENIIFKDGTFGVFNPLLIEVMS